MYYEIQIKVSGLYNNPTARELSSDILLHKWKRQGAEKKMHNMPGCV